MSRKHENVPAVINLESDDEPNSKQTRISHKVLSRIREEMDAQGVTQLELSRRTGIFSTRFSKWWAGTGDPTVYHIAVIAEALGRTVGYFFGEDTDPMAFLDPQTRIVVELVGDGPGQIKPSQALLLIVNAMKANAIWSTHEGIEPRAGIPIKKPLVDLRRGRGRPPKAKPK